MQVENEVWGNMGLLPGDWYSLKTMGVTVQADHELLHEPAMAAEPIAFANSDEQFALEVFEQTAPAMGEK